VINVPATIFSRAAIYRLPKSFYAGRRRLCIEERSLLHEFSEAPRSGLAVRSAVWVWRPSSQQHHDEDDDENGAKAAANVRAAVVKSAAAKEQDQDYQDDDYVHDIVPHGRLRPGRYQPAGGLARATA
jgi:hypothetical protein